MEFLEQLKPDYLLIAGVIGTFLGLLFFLIFLTRRILRLFSLFSRQKEKSPHVKHSLRNLIFILLWTSILGMMMFLGFFLRAYHAFTFEKPVAEIIIQKADSTQIRQITLVQYIEPDSEIVRTFTLAGDQWMLEGDILKWDNWLNFAGLHTRYRLTRLRSRYIDTREEIEKEPTVHALVEDEAHPLWQYLYQYGHYFPFISTVYGNAVIQTAGKDKHFLVYVGTSGFIVRQKNTLR